jgi:hypothetical protein
MVNMHRKAKMNRRGFLGSLAALIAARHVKPAEAAPVPTLPALPVQTSGFVRVEDGNGYTVWAIDTNATASTVWIDYDAHMKGEGVTWHYTSP